MLSGPMLKLLSTGDGISGSNPGSALGFSSSWQLFHLMYGLGVSVSLYFVHALSCVVFRGGSHTLLTTDQGRPFSCTHVHIRGSYKFLYPIISDIKWKIDKEEEEEKMAIFLLILFQYDWIRSDSDGELVNWKYCI